MVVQTESAKQTIATLKNYLSMYSYADLIRNYTLEPRFAMAIDIMARLDAVKTENVSEYTFQSSTKQALDDLRDPHTKYVKSTPTTTSP